MNALCSVHVKEHRLTPHLSHPDLTLLSRDFKIFFFVYLFGCRCRRILHSNVYDHVFFCPCIEHKTNFNIPIYFFSSFFCFVLLYFSVGNFQVTIYGFVVVKKQKFEKKNAAPKDRQKIKNTKKF